MNRFVFSIAVFLSTALAHAAPTTRPNIVLILADDLGYSDLGCYGGEIPTPNIDRLAHNGVRFTQFYNNSWCCPSRASLMTGRYPHQVGIGAMIDPYAKWVRDAANTPAYSDQLSKESPTMPEVLRDAGYQTMMVGKWHLGYRPDAWPAARGFDKSFALIGGAMNYFGSETGGTPPLMALGPHKTAPEKEGFYSTDAFADCAVTWLKDAATKPDKPFFLYLAFNAPHWPLQAHPGDIARHRGEYKAGWQSIREARYERMRKLGVIDERVAMAPMDRGNVKPWNELTDAQRDEWELRMAVFAAMVETMDRGVGRVMDALRTSNADENTLVLFLSDNGGAAEDPNRGTGPTGTRDSFRGYARPWASVSNTPFCNHKVTIYEGGISAPLIAHWPAKIPQERRGNFVREPAHLIDLLPSFLDIAEDDVTRPKLEGRSIAKMFKGEPGDANRTFAWEHEGHRGIREGKWKLVELQDAKAWELFDIDADRAEQNNLAEKHPGIVKELSEAYEQWATRCGVVPWEQIAAKRPTNAPKK